MRSFIEFIRRQAPIVYVGSVKEVRVVQRTKFDIKAKAIVDVKAVIRTIGSDPHQANIEYSSYDEKTPMLEGGSQYQLRPGVSVLAFANSFDARIPPDTSCTATVRNWCSGLMRCAMLSAGCLLTSSK